MSVGKSLNLKHIAIGNKLQILIVLRPEIVILRHHDSVAVRQILFLIQHPRTYTAVVQICHLVAPCNDQRLFGSYLAPTVLQGLNHLFPVETNNISTVTKYWLSATNPRLYPYLSNTLPYPCGFGKNTAVQRLAGYLR